MNNAINEIRITLEGTMSRITEEYQRTLKGNRREKQAKEKKEKKKEKKEEKK